MGGWYEEKSTFKSRVFNHPATMIISIILCVLGLMYGAIQVGIGLSAYSCQQRWALSGYSAKMNFVTCVVEVSPGKWIPDTKALKVMLD